MINFRHHGSFTNMETFLKRMENLDIRRACELYAQDGVAALSAVTPRDSGVSSISWGYRVRVTRRSVTITWTNSSVNQGFPIAVMLQYGYGTGTGGYVQGRDYINPAIRPVFDRIAEGVWKVVTSA